ncbi:MAG: chorismate synthase [Candidatus Korarchaeota archaeon]|nr:chorismate synthase [Candidatus Korarchaeota archaeon]
MIGRAFRLSLFGESHGRCVGALVEGCPPGVPFDEGLVRADLDRRRPGSAPLVSQRSEPDEFEVLSGVYRGRTTGGPVVMVVWNIDVDSTPYESVDRVPRPGHADYTAKVKYMGFGDPRGGGHLSGRMTAGLVMAGSLAKMVLRVLGVSVAAHLVQVGGVRLDREVEPGEILRAASSGLWCADPSAARLMEEEILRARYEGDSVGGIVEAVATGVPVGLGEPLLEGLEGEVARLILAIPAAKGVEFGAGFRLAPMRGSEANDQFAVSPNGTLTRLSNNAGGVEGGISNGMPLRLRVAFKPTPSIPRSQRSVDLEEMREVELRVSGRHDPCVAVRAVPAVEAALAVALADHTLRWLSWMEWGRSLSSGGG